jgi:hypothetical protein
VDEGIPIVPCRERLLLVAIVSLFLRVVYCTTETRDDLKRKSGEVERTDQEGQTESR